MTIDLERYDKSIPCDCGGYCDRVDCTAEECQQHGCHRDRPGSECCARAFVCRVCKARYAMSAPAPEMDDYS